MPPSLAAASASLPIRAWLCAVTIRSVLGRDLGGDDQLGIGLHHDLDAGGLGGRGKPVLGVGHHDP